MEVVSINDQACAAVNDVPDLIRNLPAGTLSLSVLSAPASAAPSAPLSAPLSPPPSPPWSLPSSASGVEAIGTPTRRVKLSHETFDPMLAEPETFDPMLAEPSRAAENSRRWVENAGSWTPRSAGADRKEGGSLAAGSEEALTPVLAPVVAPVVAPVFAPAFAPVLLVVLLPWLTTVGFSQWPPPAQMGREPSHIASISGLASNPHTTLTVFFCFIYGLKPSHALLSGAWQLPGRQTYHRSSRSEAGAVTMAAVTARRSLLLCWVLLGGSLAIGYVWQPFFHLACRYVASVSAIVHFAAVGALMALGGDRPMASSSGLPSIVYELRDESPLLLLSLVGGIACAVVALLYLPNLERLEVLERPYAISWPRLQLPGSPADDDGLRVSEICVTILLLIAWPFAARRLMERSFARAHEHSDDLASLLGARASSLSSGSSSSQGAQPGLASDTEWHVASPRNVCRRARSKKTSNALSVPDLV